MNPVTTIFKHGGLQCGSLQRGCFGLLSTPKKIKFMHCEARVMLETLSSWMEPPHKTGRVSLCVSARVYVCSVGALLSRCFLTLWPQRHVGDDLDDESNTKAPGCFGCAACS